MSAPVCPQCGSAATGQAVCTHCGFVFAAVKQLPTRAQWEYSQADAANRAARQEAFSQRVHEFSVRWWKLGLALALVAVIGLGAYIAAGPNVSALDVERALGTELQKDAPPATVEGEGLKSVECERNGLRSTDWTCVVVQEIAILPDAHAVFAVTVDDDRCWRARLVDDGPDFDGDALLGQQARGCVRS